VLMTLPPGWLQYTVMSMSVCLSVHLHNSKTTQPNFTKFDGSLCRSAWSDGVVACGGG